MKTYNDDLVSVIIPTYKRPALLKRAIESVLAQSYNNIEIIVVDDNNPGSRGAMLALILGLFYYLFKVMPELKKNKKFWGGILVFIVAAGIVYLYLYKNLSKVILNRLLIETIVSDKGSGRLIIWNNILKILLKNPERIIFGYGYGTSKVVYQENFGTARAAHNVFLQLLVEVGIVGFVIFVKSFYFFWSNAKRNKCYVANSLIIVLFITFLFLSFFSNKGCWNIYLIAFLLSSNISEEENKNNFLYTKYVKSFELSPSGVNCKIKFPRIATKNFQLFCQAG